MTPSLALYSVGSRLIEPLLPGLLARRVRRGKESNERIGERLGLTDAPRPDGPLIWMHGASVGESRLLLDLLKALRSQRPDLRALITTQTLTSAALVGAAGPHVIHQMAPVDTPGPVRRFLDHWRPDAAVFAEGEIWPNLLIATAKRNIPGALINARMTAKTLDGWRARSGAARRVFSAFRFLEAADLTTAEALAAILGRPVDGVGNLKRAALVEAPSESEVLSWRRQAGGRPIVLAASTHPGEDEIALNAFHNVRARVPDCLLILVPRHPERGPDIADMARHRGLTAQLRSLNPNPPSVDVDVLVADTMGELLFWYAVSDAIYLGGAHAEDIGGHNPFEPAQLGKRVFTGPLGFNFADSFEALADIGAVVVGPPTELATYWLDQLETNSPRNAALDAFFADARGPFDITCDALLAMLPAESVYA